MHGLTFRVFMYYQRFCGQGHCYAQCVEQVEQEFGLGGGASSNLLTPRAVGVEALAEEGRVLGEGNLGRAHVPVFWST